MSKPENNEINIDEIVINLKNAIIKSLNHEELRRNVTNCLEEKILKPLGLGEIERLEYSLSSKRVDALYGHIIFEFKTPGKLSSKADIESAKNQVIEYIKRKSKSEEEYRKYLGIIISDRIAFVRYDYREKRWILRGPYDIRREVVIKLVEVLRGLARKPLDVNTLIVDFGPRSYIAKKAIPTLYKKLISTKNEKTKLLFEDWLKLFKQATGYKPEELEELPKLAKEYGLEKDVNFDALIFSIHTYYALLLKLIAAEVAYLYGSGRFYRSYIRDLEDSFNRGVEEFKSKLEELESGGIFRRFLNIENFLEGDYFSWYLEELDEELSSIISEIVRKLEDFEIATPQLEPEFARDLLKRLYQHLVPGELRHRLGEYYTPDWLANLLLDEIGLSMNDLFKLGEIKTLKPLEIRVLDPACGSGTFLVLYISRLRKYAEENYLTDNVIDYILNNVVGFDLNPLAVLTARTNYLLSVADLLPYKKGIVEIPVYLADSIMIEKEENFFKGKFYILRTSVGIFEIPTEIVEKGILQNVLSEISRCLENKYSVDEFKKRIIHIFKLNEKTIDSLSKFYKKMLELEESGKNGVWIAIIRNFFAPLLKGTFDFVVGNPPWVNWENLPEQYREVSRKLWEQYGLTRIKGKIGLGKVKRDLAMLFLARCFDLYLKEGGKLGFLVPFTLFKVQAGAGFRRFLATQTKIHVIHDLVTLYPFEGAVNRTAAIIVEKVNKDKLEEVKRENVSGIKHIVWKNLTKKPIPTDKLLEEVLSVTERYELIMAPLEKNNPESSWMQTTKRILEVIGKITSGEHYYKAYGGVYVALNQVYYVKIEGKTSDGRLIVTNPPEAGIKKKVKQIEAVVEPDLVYPLVRGKDIKMWKVEFKDTYIILPVDPEGNDISLKDMIIKYPNTYTYFYNFFSELINRGGEPYKSKLEPYRKMSLKKAEKIAPPFYWVFNVRPSLKPYKVVWKNIAGEISGKAEFSCAVISSIDDKFLGRKILIPNVKLMLVPLENEEEAYYLCGILNSIIVRTIVASYVIETGISTHILDIITPPKFDPNNEIHKKIAQLSRKAHEICNSNLNKRELEKIEEEININVAELFGLSKDELEEFKRLLDILK